MYFIMRGDCIVDMVDYNNVKHENLKILVKSDYFGEIPFFHNCLRTCTVLSRNYNTMARLTYERLRMQFRQFPNFRK
jgi:hypothetical protein